MNKWLFCVLMMLITTLSWADSAYYKVEVLAFKHRTGQPLDPQDWQGDALSADLAKAKTLLSHDDVLPQNINPGVPLYQALPDTEWELKKQHRALKQQRDYEVLAHTAWIQTLDSPRIPPVRFGGGSALMRASEEADSIHSDAPMLTQELDGVIKASRQHPRYITIEANLALSEQAPQQETFTLYYHDAMPATPQFQHYYLRQKERLKIGELHYFDHPLFGLLVKVTPYEVQTQARNEVEDEDNQTA